MSVKFIPEIDELLGDLGIPGIAAIILLPVIIPVAGKVVKPIAKAFIKGGIIIYEQGRGVIAEVGETLEDVIAEAKAELETESSKAQAIEGAIEAQASAN